MTPGPKENPPTDVHEPRTAGVLPGVVCRRMRSRAVACRLRAAACRCVLRHAVAFRWQRANRATSAATSRGAPSTTRPRNPRSATTSTLPLNSYGLCTSNYSLCSYCRQINLAGALARLRGPLRARQPEEEKDDDEEAPAAEGGAAGLQLFLGLQKRGLGLRACNPGITKNAP